MNKKIKNISKILIGFIIIIIISLRIIYVNINARLPEEKCIYGREKLMINDVEYNVENAYLYNYDDYIKYYNLDSNELCDKSDHSTIKVVVIELKIKANGDNTVSFDMPIQYFNSHTYIDLDSMLQINKAMLEKGYILNDTVIELPYFINKENLRQEQWSKVVNNEIKYNLVFSSYPEKNMIIIDEQNLRKVK